MSAVRTKRFSNVILVGVERDKPFAMHILQTPLLGGIASLTLISISRAARKNH